MSRKVRRALARSSGAKATLSAISGSASLKRAVNLRPSLGTARVARHGLRLAGVCSTQCTISARLVASASTARRLHIRSGGHSVAIGAGRLNAAGSVAHGFTMRVARSARRALSRAKHASLTLEVVVTGAGADSRPATRRVTLG